MDDKIYVKMNVLDAWVFKSTEIKRAMEKQDKVIGLLRAEIKNNHLNTTALIDKEFDLLKEQIVILKRMQSAVLDNTNTRAIDIYKIVRRTISEIITDDFREQATKGQREAIAREESLEAKRQIEIRKINMKYKER